MLFNLVLEPNFVSEATHASLLDLESTTSRSHRGSLLCPDPQAQAIRASPYQICAHQAFT